MNAECLRVVVGSQQEKAVSHSKIYGQRKGPPKQGSQ